MICEKKEPYAIYDKSKYEYELKDSSIVIKEKSKAGWYPFLKVIHRSKFGATLMLDSLEEQLKDFDARWMLKKLEERRIVKIERSN